MPRTDDEWRWAEALALEKTWGANAPLRIAEGIGVLALLNDRAGVARMREIAGQYDQLISARASDEH